MKNIPQDMVSGSVHETRNCGNLVVVDYINSHLVHVRFDDPYYEAITHSQHIRRGTVKNRMRPSVFSVGYLGVGNYKSKENGKATAAYSYWKHMLARCYSQVTLKKFPSYIGCKTCPEWHNFQVFAEWFEKNFPNDGTQYELDKDIKVPGNRVYSPETCSFVTRQENNKEKNVRTCSKEAIFISPSGEKFKIVNIRAFCREQNLHQGYMSRVARGAQDSYKGWRAA